MAVTTAPRPPTTARLSATTALTNTTTTTGDETRHETGNEVTGAYVVVSDATNQTVTRHTDGPDGLSVYQTDEQTVSVTGDGNRVGGDARLTRRLTDTYHLEASLPAGEGAGFDLVIDGTLTEDVTGMTESRAIRGSLLMRSAVRVLSEEARAGDGEGAAPPHRQGHWALEGVRAQRPARRQRRANRGVPHPAEPPGVLRR
jgi:hypothetical protein